MRVGGTALAARRRAGKAPAAHTLSLPRTTRGDSHDGWSRDAPAGVLPSSRITRTEVAARNRRDRLPGDPCRRRLRRRLRAVPRRAHRRAAGVGRRRPEGASGLDGHWLISTTGGTKPVWARSGKELFYLDGAGAVTAVPVQTTPTFSAGNPTKLFDARYFAAGNGRTYDVSRDGQKFLMIKDNAGGDPTSPPTSIVVVLNWLQELRQRLPAKEEVRR